MPPRRVPPPAQARNDACCEPGRWREGPLKVFAGASKAALKLAKGSLQQAALPSETAPSRAVGPVFSETAAGGPGRSRRMPRRASPKPRRRRRPKSAGGLFLPRFSCHFSLELNRRDLSAPLGLPGSRRRGSQGGRKVQLPSPFLSGGAAGNKAAAPVDPKAAPFPHQARETCRGPTGEAAPPPVSPPSERRPRLGGGCIRHLRGEWRGAAP